MQMRKNWGVCIIKFFNGPSQIFRNWWFALPTNRWGPSAKTISKWAILFNWWIHRPELLYLAEVNWWRLWSHYQVLLLWLWLHRSVAVWISGLTALKFSFRLLDYFDYFFSFWWKKILFHLLLSGVLHDGLRVEFWFNGGLYLLLWANRSLSFH